MIQYPSRKFAKLNKNYFSRLQESMVSDTDLSSEVDWSHDFFFFSNGNCGTYYWIMEKHQMFSWKEISWKHPNIKFLGFHIVHFQFLRQFPVQLVEFKSCWLKQYYRLIYFCGSMCGFEVLCNFHPGVTAVKVCFHPFSLCLMHTIVMRNVKLPLNSTLGV